MNTLPLHGMHRCVFIFLLMAWVGSASAYDKPNSITYDPVTRDYFITNLQGKTVTRLDSSFDQKDVITGLTSPKDLLFATFGPYRGLVVLDSNAVKVFNADGYSLIASFPVSGAIDLEDGEPDKNQSSVFYLSDPKAHTILRWLSAGRLFTSLPFPFCQQRSEIPRPCCLMPGGDYW